MTVNDFGPIVARQKQLTRFVLGWRGAWVRQTRTNHFESHNRPYRPDTPSEKALAHLITEYPARCLCRGTLQRWERKSDCSCAFGRSPLQKDIAAFADETVVPSWLREQLGHLPVIDRTTIVGVNFAEHAGRLLR